LVNSPSGDFVADGNFTRTSISYALFGKCPLLDFTQCLLDLFFSIHHERIEIIERGKRKKGVKFFVDSWILERPQLKESKRDAVD
jgi:hypothetical protein